MNDDLKECVTIVGGIVAGLSILIGGLSIGSYYGAEQTQRHRMEAVAKGCQAFNDNIYCTK